MRGLGHLPDTDQTELARLLPELLAGRPTITPPGPLAEPWQRTRLFEALARAVLAARQPLLLLLDDLQWCDQETLDWLHFLLRSAPTAPLLVLTTVRQEDSRADTLQTWWELLVRHEQASLIELGALDERETQALASQLAPSERWKSYGSAGSFASRPMAATTLATTSCVRWLMPTSARSAATSCIAGPPRRC